MIRRRKIPGLGRVRTRTLPVHERHEIALEINALDLEGLAATIGQSVHALRESLYVCQVVRAGVLSPTPPMLDPAIYEEHEALKMLIDDAWPPASVTRLFRAVT